MEWLGTGEKLHARSCQQLVRCGQLVVKPQNSLSVTVAGCTALHVTLAECAALDQGHLLLKPSSDAISGTILPLQTRKQPLAPLAATPAICIHAYHACHACGQGRETWRDTHSNMFTRPASPSPYPESTCMWTETTDGLTDDDEEGLKRAGGHMRFGVIKTAIFRLCTTVRVSFPNPVSPSNGLPVGSWEGSTSTRAARWVACGPAPVDRDLAISVVGSLPLPAAGSCR
eukprot:354908-Chlamydomonas_euryale.AAC.2